MSGQAQGKLKDVSDKDAQRRLSKQEILTARVRTEPYFIPALGGEVVLRSLTRAQVEDIQTRSNWGKDEFDENLYQALSVVYAMADPEMSLADVDSIRGLENAVFQELVLEITMMNMVGRGEETKKDSEPTPS